MRAVAATAPRAGISWIGALYLIIGAIVAATHLVLVEPAHAQGLGLGAPRNGALAADPARDQPAHSLENRRVEPAGRRRAPQG